MIFELELNPNRLSFKLRSRLRFLRSLWSARNRVLVTSAKSLMIPSRDLRGGFDNGSDAALFCCKSVMVRSISVKSPDGREGIAATVGGGPTTSTARSATVRPPGDRGGIAATVGGGPTISTVRSAAARLPGDKGGIAATVGGGPMTSTERSAAASPPGDKGGIAATVGGGPMTSIARSAFVSPLGGKRGNSDALDGVWNCIVIVGTGGGREEGVTMSIIRSTSARPPGERGSSGSVGFCRLRLTGGRDSDGRRGHCDENCKADGGSV